MNSGFKKPKLKEHEDKILNNEYIYNFSTYAAIYTPLKQYVKYNKNGTCVIDWNDPSAQRRLSEAILLCEYNLKVEIPPNHLCPALTSRVMYIKWINSLLKTKLEIGSDIKGIDIGTGATCIYPLLGASIENWTFIATEIDEESISHANKTIESNDLSGRIKVLKPRNDTLLTDILQQTLEYDGCYHFCMCNPPFFSSVDEKVKRDDTNCVATDSELATIGGEENFIKRLIDESILLKDKIIWFTSLVGRKVNLKSLKNYLKLLSPLPKFIETSEFKPGKTARWAIAWTFSEPAASYYRDIKRKELMKQGWHQLTYLYTIKAMTVPIEALENILKDLKLPHQYNEHLFKFTVTIYQTTDWYTQQLGSEQTEASNSIGPEFPPKLGFKMEISVNRLTQKDLYTLKFSIIQKGEKHEESVHLFGLLSYQIHEHLQSIELDVADARK